MSKVGKLAALPCGRRTKWIVLVFWIIVLALAGPLAGKLTGAEKNDTSSWLPGSAESTKALDIQDKFLSSDTLIAVLVYERNAGITPQDMAQATADVPALQKISGVEGKVKGPIPSKDGKALQTLVPLNFGSEGWNKAPDAVDNIRDTAGIKGVHVNVTGPAGNAADQGAAFEGIDGTLLYGTIAVVVVILLLTYRSPVLWLLPVISAGLALTSAQAVIYLLAKHAGLTVNAQSAGILTVLVFGAGTDYALLLVARYREELRRHEDRHEAMAYALHRAGPAIVASAATVAAGMLCLLVAEMNSTKSLGPVNAIGIGVGLLAMLTLLPALLVIFSRWVFWPIKPRFGTEEPTKSGLWARVGHGIAGRPRTVWITTAIVLGIFAIGVTSLNSHTLSNKETFTSKPSSIVGQEALDRHFPAGAGQPVAVVGNAAEAGPLKTAFANTRGISASSITQPEFKSGYAYLEGTLTDPPDSSAARSTIDRVRDSVHAVPNADAKVGGGTAVALDIQRASRHDISIIIPLVLTVVLLILALLLRALVAPFILVATVVLSFGAALGLSALAFKHIFGFGGTDTSLPLFVFVFLVALGIDYNIFLMTRVREEALQTGMRRGAVNGLAATGGVITAAGFVLAGTFSVLATLPLVAFAEIGFAVALGVLLDTIVVRSILVTALNLDIGRTMWWPSKLAAKRDVPDDPPGDSSSFPGAVPVSP